MRAFRVILALFCAGVFSLAAFSDTGKEVGPDKPKAEAVKDIEGIYTCSGTDAGTNKKYRGICTIERANQIYIVTWTIGGSSFTGVGIKVSDAFSVGWAVDGKNPAPRGVNVYRIGAKTLSGTWASLPGNGTVNREVLTFLKELDKDDADEKDK